MKYKNKLLKLILSLSCAFALIIGQGTSAFAAENTQNTFDPEIIEMVSENYDITEDEVKNLEENLDKAVASLPELKVNEDIVVPVSEHLVLKVSTEDCDNSIARATYSRTITSTMKLENVFGVTIVTLKSVGVFSTNGSTSKPTDAYGSYSATGWDITKGKSVLGATGYNSYVRNSFSGKLRVGIDPVNMTIQSFSYNCTIKCNAVGTYSSSWQ